MIDNLSPPLFLREQFALGQDLDVLGNGLSRRAEMPGNHAGREGGSGYQGEDAPSSGISQCLKNVSS
jgi:hypothetical protein